MTTPKSGPSRLAALTPSVMVVLLKTQLMLACGKVGFVLQTVSTGTPGLTGDTGCVIVTLVIASIIIIIIIIILIINNNILIY